MTINEAYKFVIDVMEAKGFGNSVFHNVAVDSKGNPLPWISYPAIDYAAGLDLRGCRLFEFGCGCSTLFWSSRCKQVVSVENNSEWFEKLASVLPQNCKLLLRQDEQTYVGAIEEAEGEFDIIAIDGAFNRRKMAERAIRKLANGGFIILDNSDCHVHAAKFLRDYGLIQIDFVGFAPMNKFEQATSFFLKRDVNLKPIAEWQPIKSAGAMAHVIEE